MIDDKHVASCMAHAFLCAAKSKAPDVAVGAVLVRSMPDCTYQIVSDGYNGTPAGESNTTIDDAGKTLPNVRHAERNVIRKAALSGNLVNPSDLSLFVTHVPCLQCAMLIYDMGIRYVYFYHPYKHGDLHYLTSRGVTCIKVHNDGDILNLLTRSAQLVEKSRVD